MLLSARGRTPLQNQSQQSSSTASDPPTHQAPYTPEHSSWLNKAEVEISVLAEQCLERRMGSQGIVANEIGAWESEWNTARVTIDWRFTIPDAREKLKKFSPVSE